MITRTDAKLLTYEALAGQERKLYKDYCDCIESIIRHAASKGLFYAFVDFTPSQCHRTVIEHVARAFTEAGFTVTTSREKRCITLEWGEEDYE